MFSSDSSSQSEISLLGSTLKQRFLESHLNGGREYSFADDDEEYGKNLFYCGMCYENIDYSQVIELTCLHKFCKPCLNDFYSYYLAKNPSSCCKYIVCPDVTCKKRQLSIKELDMILDSKQMEMYMKAKEVFDVINAKDL